MTCALMTNKRRWSTHIFEVVKRLWLTVLNDFRRLFSLLSDMPTVNFVGEIASSVVDVEEISVTWAIVPGILLDWCILAWISFNLSSMQPISGNSAWYLKRGISSGETHTCQSSSTVGTSTISHPIDCQFASSSSEGWPIFVCEVKLITLDSGLFS